MIRVLSFGAGQGELKYRASRPIRIRPQPAPGSIDDGPADRRPHPHSAGLRGVECLENALDHSGSMSGPESRTATRTSFVRLCSVLSSGCRDRRATGSGDAIAVLPQNLRVAIRVNAVQRRRHHLSDSRRRAPGCAPRQAFCGTRPRPPSAWIPSASLRNASRPLILADPTCADPSSR
jgi:hypothetical protein